MSDCRETSVIPTASRSKISHLVSFPIGAERISEALAPVPQLELLVLRFFAGLADGLRKVRLDGTEAFEFLRAEYLWDAPVADEYPISQLYPRPPQFRWEVVVQPVLRIDRHPVGEYIITSALPRTREWLLKRSGQTQRGSEVLAFFYRRDDRTFVAKELSRIEPATAKRQ